VAISRRRLFAIGLCGALGAILLILLAHPYSRQSVFGPKLDGMPLCYWQDAFRTDTQRAPVTESMAARAGRWFGFAKRDSPRGMPSEPCDKLTVFLSLVDDPDPGVRESVAQHLGSWDFPSDQRGPALIKLLEDREGDVRAAAARSLRRVRRPFLPEVVPVLVKMLDDPDLVCRMSAAYVLWRMGEKQGHDIVGVLREVLQHPDPRSREESVRMLGELGKDANTAFADLARCAMGDSVSWVRSEALATLRTLGPPAIPVLVKALNDSDAGNRQYAATALGKLGSDAQDAVPSLRGLLNDPVPAVCAAAAAALEGIDPERFPPRAVGKE
jgi:HEAT repeat protein